MPPAVRVSEYTCVLEKGAHVEVEQFVGPSISIVRSGVFGFRSDGDDRILTTDFLMLANPGQAYEISHDHAGGDCGLVFHFDEDALEDVARHSLGATTRRYFARSVLPPIPRIDALRHLAEQRLVSGGPALGLDEVGLMLAAHALEHANANVASNATKAISRPHARDTVYAALQHLEHAASEELRLADVARAVGLSPFHFLRLFKRETGVTPYRFVIQARIRKAIVLLRETNLPVTRVALDVGFADLSNFINAFRREVGSSPARFRKSLRA